MKKIILILSFILIAITAQTQSFSFHYSGYVSTSGNFISISGSGYYSTYSGRGGSSLNNVEGIPINSWVFSNHRNLITFGKSVLAEPINIENDIFNSRKVRIYGEDTNINIFNIELMGNKNDIIKTIGNKSTKLIKTEVSFKKVTDKINEKRINSVDEQSLRVLGILPNVEIYEFISYKPINNIVIDGNLIFLNDSLIYSNFTIFHNEPEFKINDLVNNKFGLPTNNSLSRINYCHYSKNNYYLFYDSESYSMYKHSKNYKFSAKSTFANRTELTKLIFEFYTLIENMNKESAKSLYDAF